MSNFNEDIIEMSERYSRAIKLLRQVLRKGDDSATLDDIDEFLCEIDGFDIDDF